MRHVRIGSKSQHSPRAQSIGSRYCSGQYKMKTDDLIAMLSTNIEPVDHGLVARMLYTALALGSVGAVGIILIGLGIRPDLATANALVSLFLKIAFTLGIIGVASLYLTRLARPGGERKLSLIFVAIPFVAIVVLAAISIASAPSTHWNRMIVGNEWLECLLSIPIIAIVPFATTIWTLRKAAPTNLVRAGAFAGLISGGVSAMAYSLHCTDDSLSFIAVWFGGTIAVCTLAGALLGPRLLRW